MTLIGDLLLYLAHADSRKVGLGYLRSLSRPFSQHIIKLLVWKGSTNSRDYWIDEIIDNYIEDILDTKLTKNQKFKRNDYYNCLFKPYLENLEQFSENVEKWVRYFEKKKNYPQPPEYNINDLWNKYHKFQEDALKLFTQKEIQAEDFKDVLERLGE